MPHLPAEGKKIQENGYFCFMRLSNKQKEVIDGLNELHHQSQYLASVQNDLLIYIRKREWLGGL